MKRIPSLLLCGLFLATDATARAQTAAEADYLRARRDAQAAYERSQATFNQKAALASLERKLRAIIGPVNVPSFPQPGQINLEAVCRGEEGCETLDGIIYRKQDWSRRLLVTTPALMSSWLGNGGVSIDSALRTPDKYSDAFGSHAAVLHYANLAVPDAQRRGIVAAMLILEAQDVGRWPPRSVIVTVVRKNRIYIMLAPTAVAIDTVPGCGARLDSAFRAKPDSVRQLSMQDEDKAYESYRACFAENLATVPGIDKVIDQVMALADAVPPTAAKNYGLSDDAALQGTWRVVDARARMSNEPAMIIDGLIGRGTVEFRDSTVIMRQLPHADFAAHPFFLDTLTFPRQLKMIDTTASDGGKWIGLYRVYGDTLRLSLPISRDGNRPSAPAAFNAPNTAAYILTRVPPKP